MKTETLKIEDPDALTYAFEVLTGGGLVAFPTDTVYGLGALALDGKAVRKIYAAKKRPVEKAIPILVGDMDGLSKVVAGTNEVALKLAARFWPGPLTLVLPKHASISKMVSSTPSVGVRIPNHPAALALLRLVGPMAVTSANISGQPSPATAQEVLEQLDKRIPLILDGGRTPGGVPSTVVDCLGLQPTILRPGPVTLEEIQSAISGT